MSQCYKLLQKHYSLFGRCTSSGSCLCCPSEQHVAPGCPPAGPPIGTFELIRSPTCLLNALSPSRLTSTSSPLISSPNPTERTRATFECIHLGESLEPVRCSGTTIMPDKTFAGVQQASDSGGDAGDKIDVMLLPGGFGARPWNASEGLKGFVKWAAEHVETTLTGMPGLVLQTVVLVRARQHKRVAGDAAMAS